MFSLRCAPPEVEVNQSWVRLSIGSAAPGGLLIAELCEVVQVEHFVLRIFHAQLLFVFLIAEHFKHAVHFVKLRAALILGLISGAVGIVLVVPDFARIELRINDLNESQKNYMQYAKIDFGSLFTFKYGRF